MDRNKAAHIEAKANAEASRVSIERIKTGEEVGPQHEPLDGKAVLRSMGWSKAQIGYVRLLAMLPRERVEEFVRSDRYHVALDRRRRAMLRKYVRNLPLDALDREHWVEIMELLYPNFVWPETQAADD